MSVPKTTNRSNAKANRLEPTCPQETEEVYLVVPHCSPKVLPFDRPWYIAWFVDSSHLLVLELHAASSYFIYGGPMSRQGDFRNDETFLLGAATHSQLERLVILAGNVPVKKKSSNSVWNHQSWVKDILWRAAHEKIFDSCQVQDCISAAALVASYR